MFARSKLRGLLEARKPRGFVQSIYQLLGLADANGNRYRDSFGRPQCRNPQVRPQEFSLRCLAETIFGTDFETDLQPDRLNKFSRWSEAMDQQGTPLLEAGGVDVTHFVNINAFNATVGGLIDFQILAGFDAPGYEISNLFTSIPTRLNGQRMGRIGSIGDVAARRRPGEGTARVGLNEEWIDTPETEEYALSIEVNQEAVFFDLTQDVLNKANSIGEAVRYRKEVRCIDVLIGETNPYEYKDTAYNTYLDTDPAAAGEWLNDSVNAFADQTDIDNALQLFSRMTDPSSGKRVIIAGPYSLVTVPALEMLVAQVLGATGTEQRTASAAEIRHTINWVSGKIGTVIASPLMHMALRDAAKTTGGNLTEANSKRWWMISNGAYGYMENWPLRTDQANPQTKEMLDRGILAFYKASERGVPIVQEPRKAVRNKVA